MEMFRSPLDRFVVATVGWEPLYAVVGKDLKARMAAGVSLSITDPDDQPLSDGSDALAANAARMMRALRGDTSSGEPRAAEAEPRK